MSNYRERREAGHYEPGARTAALEPDDETSDDEDEDEPDQTQQPAEAKPYAK